VLWSARHASRTGLTLFELIVALAILLAIGALVLPTTSVLMQRASFDADVERLRAAVIETGVIARRAATPLAITLEDDGMVARPWPVDEGSQGDPVLAVSLKEVLDPEGEQLTEPQLIAVALPDGSYAVTGPLTIVHEDGGQVTLEIDPTSGIVRIESQ